MKSIIGVILVIIGILVGLYVGGWLMLVGGIIQIVNSIKDGVIAGGIGIGVARVVFSSFFGWLSAIILIAPGMTMIKSGVFDD